jgi:hypothetical protein
MATERALARLAASRARRALTLDSMVSLVTDLDCPLTINQSSAVKTAYQRALRSTSPTLGNLAQELRRPRRTSPV